MKIPTTTFPQPGNDDSRYATMQADLIQQIKRGMKKHKITGLSIGLVDNGELVWAQGFGYADKEKQRLADEQTIYKVGSITKVFTGTAIMQLVEQEKINLDIHIQTYIPELKIRYHTATDKAITLRSIMTHTSGLPGDTLSGMFAKQPESFHKAIDFLNNTHAPYPPGTIVAYSNLATDLLGIVIERMSGETYADYIQNNILNPLGMKQSSTADSKIDQNLMSRSYLKHKYHEEFPLRSLPAGNLHSNVFDMARFINAALANGNPLISKTSFDEMTSIQSKHIQYESDMNFGLNWLVQRPQIDHLGSVIWHNGGTINFASTMVILPQHQLGVVILANSAGSNTLIENTANDILNAATAIKCNISQPIEPPMEQAIKTPEEVIKTTLGSYATAMGPTIVKQSGNRLLARVSGKNLYLQYHKDGWFSLRYKLFDLIPIPLKDLQKLRIRVTSIAGEKVLLAKDGGFTSIGGQAFKPEPLNKIWRSRLGNYTIEYSQGDYHWMDKVCLKQLDGFFIITLRIDKRHNSSLIIHPIDNDTAIIQGLGRGLQETIYVNGEGNTTVLSFSGYRIRKTN